MGGEYPGSIWNPSPHFWNGHAGAKVNYIILHGTAGFTTAQQVANYFHDDNPPTSVHYIVGRDGTIVQCVSESDSAWGNGVITKGHASWWTGNPNWYTFSIEHVKSDPANAENLTSAQQDAAFKLIAYLCAKHGVPARPADKNGGITGHFSIDPVNRSFCPGTYPWSALWSYLNDPTAAAQAAAQALLTSNVTSNGSGGNTTLNDQLGGGSGGLINFDWSGLFSGLTNLFPFLTSSWIQNAGWNLLKIALGTIILGIVLVGLVINIVGADVLGAFGGPSRGAGKALATFAAIP